MKRITSVLKVGQEFVDDPILVRVRPVAANVMSAIGHEIPSPIPSGRYERVRLRWMEPDGKGGVREKKL